jgi:hypothetical protein
LLCDHLGKAPRSAKINITIKIVPSILFSLPMAMPSLLSSVRRSVLRGIELRRKLGNELAVGI